VTGSRHWTRKDVISRALHEAIDGASEPVTVVHGGAPGADTIAGEVAEALGAQVEVHAANWQLYGHAAGAIRNQQMVRAGADICLAFPLGKSPGTRDCMSRALKTGITVSVYTEEDENA